MGSKGFFCGPGIRWLLMTYLHPQAKSLRSSNPKSISQRSGTMGRGCAWPPTSTKQFVRISASMKRTATNSTERPSGWTWRPVNGGISASSSFASLVTACEALTERGSTHRVHCEQCDADSTHEVPGATERFRTFFEIFAQAHRFGSAALKCTPFGPVSSTEAN